MMRCGLHTLSRVTGWASLTATVGALLCVFLR